MALFEYFYTGCDHQIMTQYIAKSQKVSFASIPVVGPLKATELAASSPPTGGRGVTKHACSDQVHSHEWLSHSWTHFQRLSRRAMQRRCHFCMVCPLADQQGLPNTLPSIHKPSMNLRITIITNQTESRNRGEMELPAARSAWLRLQDAVFHSRPGMGEEPKHTTGQILLLHRKGFDGRRSYARARTATV